MMGCFGFRKVSSPEPVSPCPQLPKEFGCGGLRMKRAFGFGLSLIALVSFVTSDVLAAGSNKSLATISGTVRDNRGNPLAGALVSLVREGVKTVKEARTDKPVSYTHLRAHETPEHLVCR